MKESKNETWMHTPQTATAYISRVRLEMASWEAMELERRMGRDLDPGLKSKNRRRF